MFLPLGLDDMKVGRIPWLSLGIAVFCILAYLATMGAPEEAYRAYGLVPADGFAQLGWLTSTFIHVGVLHLIGNLIFLYVAAPCVEDAWGLPRFLLLFFGGALAADLTQYFLDPGSPIPVVGASGAIAACMGALCVQFPRRKVRMVYWLYVVTGSFFLPVWLWGGLWFGREVLDLVMWGAGSGVAFGAHVGGFLFGAGLAFAIIKLQGDPFELKYGRKTATEPPAVPEPAAKPEREPEPAVALAPLAPLEVAPSAAPGPTRAPPSPDDPFAPAPPPKVAAGKRRAFPKRPM